MAFETASEQSVSDLTEKLEDYFTTPFSPVNFVGLIKLWKPRPIFPGAIPREVDPASHFFLYSRTQYLATVTAHGDMIARRRSVAAIDFSSTVDNVPL